MGSADFDTAKVYQGLFIDLILSEEFLVIAKIPQEPIELPEGPFGAVEPAGERTSFEGIRLKHNVSKRTFRNGFWVGASGRKPIPLGRETTLRAGSPLAESNADPESVASLLHLRHWGIGVELADQAIPVFFGRGS